MTEDLDSHISGNDPDVRIGVIGAGTWGANLVRTLNELDVLAGVAEISSVVRAGLVEEYPGLQVHETPAGLVRSGVSAVAIATPVPTHFPIAVEAVRHGLDVFVEKPITLSVREAEDLVSLAMENDRILMVGHLLLYQPAVAWIRRFLDEGGLGQLHSIHMERLNLGKARPAESVLWSLGVHDVAVALYLVGASPGRVAAEGQCVLQEGIEDDTYLHMGFGNGVDCHLHNSWLWPERRRRTVLIGSEGMLVYDEIEQTVVLHRKSITPGLENMDDGSELVYEGHGQPLLKEMEHFISCVRGRETPLSDGRSAVEVLKVLETADMQIGG